MLVSFHLAGDFLALLDSHNFAAIFAVKNGIVCDLESSFWRAETKELLFDPSPIQIRQELISAILQFLKLSIRHAIGNMRYDFWVQVAEADLAAVDNWREHFLEELLPDLFINPFDLQEMASYELIQAILISNLKEFFIDSELLFSWWHFFQRRPILRRFCEFNSVIGLNLNNINKPVKGIRIAVHSDFNSFSFFDLWNDFWKVRDSVLVLLKPFSFEEYLFEDVFLYFGGGWWVIFFLATLVIAWRLPEENFNILEIKCFCRSCFGDRSISVFLISWLR